MFLFHLISTHMMRWLTLILHGKSLLGLQRDYHLGDVASGLFKVHPELWVIYIYIYMDFDIYIYIFFFLHLDIVTFLTLQGCSSSPWRSWQIGAQSAAHICVINDLLTLWINRLIGVDRRALLYVDFACSLQFPPTLA